MSEEAIPERYVEFARSVAKLAKERAITHFEATFIEHWNARPEDGLRREIKIFYKGVDGRGRPAHNLQIVAECTLKVAVIE